MNISIKIYANYSKQLSYSLHSCYITPLLFKSVPKYEKAGFLSRDFFDHPKMLIKIT